jgi:hypothetical protein
VVVRQDELHGVPQSHQEASAALQRHHVRSADVDSGRGMNTRGMTMRSLLISIALVLVPGVAFAGRMDFGAPNMYRVETN